MESADRLVAVSRVAASGFAAVLVCILMLPAANAWAQTAFGGLRGGLSTPMWSKPGPGERDTAADGGQAGGQKLGRGYELETLRCPSGQAIVGAQVRRGDVLDYVQIACAVPRCDMSGCSWNPNTLQWGAEAGNDAGGDPQPPMICPTNAVMTGFQSPVVTFTVFDYAAGMSIECSPLASGADSNGFFAVGAGLPSIVSTGNPYNFVRAITTQTSPLISCRPNGAASAVSVATANFVNPGQRVVQAVSLYCPANQVAPQSFCQVQVGFEFIGIKTLVGLVNGMHAVVILSGPGFPTTGYEGNPTGGFPNWGTLTTRVRDMQARPLGREAQIETAGQVAQSCSQVAQQMDELENRVNSAGLPYNPTPDLTTNAVNSNSFAFWAVTQLGFAPPGAPNPVLFGQTPGYNGSHMNL
jgi:hypothetical protein